MVKFLSICFFLVLHSSIFAIDSLLLIQKTVELNELQGSKKLELLTELSSSLTRSMDPNAKSFTKQAFALAATLKDSTAYYKSVANLAIIYSKEGKYEDCLQLQKTVLAFYKDNPIEKAKALKNLGSIFTEYEMYQKADSILALSQSIFNSKNNIEGLMNNKLKLGLNYLAWNKYDLAESSFKEALKYSLELKDTYTTSSLWNNLGIVARRQGDLDKALAHYFQASINHKETDFFKAKIYNNIGIIYKTLGDFDKALEYYQKSLAIKQNLKLQKSSSYTLHNIGTVYKQKMDYGEALKYYNLSLEIKKNLIGVNTDITKTINNIGNVYLLLGDYEKAETHYLEHLQVSEKEKNDHEICRAINNLSALSLKQNKYQLAIDYGLRSLDIATRINYPQIIRSSSQNLAEGYKAIGDSYKHLFYQNQYWVVNDSLINQETANNISYLETDYYKALKEQNTALEKDNKSLFTSNLAKPLLVGLYFLVGLLLTWKLTTMKFQRMLEYSEKKWTSSLEKSNSKIQILEKKLSNQKLLLANEKKDFLTTETTISTVEREPKLSNIHSFLNENLRTEENWQDFQHYFTTVHKDFFKTLKSNFPKLTTYDLNLAAFIKLNLHNKEIAQTLGISPLSVKKARQRLSKKMNLTNNEALVNYIIQL